MRVLLATNMYPTPAAPYLGVFVRLQEEALRALGVEIEVATHVGRLSRWNYPRALPDLVRRLRAGRFDLVHTHHTYSTLLALAARRLAGVRIPVVQTFHESEIFRRATALDEDPLRRLHNWLPLKAFALRHADFVIPVQRDMLRAVLSEAAAARVPHCVLPVGLDLDRFSPGDTAAARRRLGWPEEGCVVFFPCDPRKPEKRFDLVQAGFERFARDRPGARLVTSGKIPDEEMVDTIRAADVILLPTDYEASPSAVKEALACERVVVSTDVGDVKECFGDLPGVLLCDWTAEDVARKLARALAVPTPYGGRARLDRLGLGLEASARRLLAVFEQVSGRAGR